MEHTIRKVVNDLKSLGVVVASVIADNAKNIQKGLKLAATNLGYVVANCWAHTLNLLVKDLTSLFKRQFDEMNAVDVFFRCVHCFFGLPNPIL